jgi:transcriptional regulator with PAS, ATPase and Fis domain
VLITGESGVGKEIVARCIHSQGRRSRNVFVPVNCAGLPETLLESELFGFVKGSFTGAYRDKPGKLEAADNGTVLLDEIGEMTMRMQGLLLRFLETGELQKVGADAAGRHVDVRVIAATNRNLREMVGRGAFREDLFYRLNVLNVVVPPLRERREDVPVLVSHFLERYAASNRPSNISVSDEAMKAMAHHNWPGNVRELENVIERLVVTVPGDVIEVDHLPDELRGAGRGAQRAMRTAHRDVVEDLYTRMLEQHESFWTSVYLLFMDREITKAHVRDVVRLGLIEARGNYRLVTRLFNVDVSEYRRFLNFLKKHDCQLPFKEYR